MWQAPSLLLPYPSKPYEVETNASDYVVGVILYQDGKLTPINTSSSKGTFYIANGLLYRNGKVCVPNLLKARKKILFECHDVPSIGHPRIHHTLVLISSEFFWPKMCPNVEDYTLTLPI